MKLERMNENSEMFFTTKLAKTEEQQKFEIIEKLSEHWNKALKQDYLVPRSLYNYTLSELKDIENHYLNGGLNERKGVEQLSKNFTGDYDTDIKYIWNLITQKRLDSCWETK